MTHTDGLSLLGGVVEFPATSAPLPQPESTALSIKTAIGRTAISFTDSALKMYFNAFLRDFVEALLSPLFVTVDKL